MYYNILVLYALSSVLNINYHKTHEFEFSVGIILSYISYFNSNTIDDTERKVILRKSLNNRYDK